MIGVPDQNIVKGSYVLNSFRMYSAYILYLLQKSWISCQASYRGTNRLHKILVQYKQNIVKGSYVLKSFSMYRGYILYLLQKSHRSAVKYLIVVQTGYLKYSYK